MKVIVELRGALYSWLMWVMGIGIMKWITGSTNWQEVLLLCLVGGLPMAFVVMTGEFVIKKGDGDADVHS